VLSGLHVHAAAAATSLAAAAAVAAVPGDTGNDVTAAPGARRSAIVCS